MLEDRQVMEVCRRTSRADGVETDIVFLRNLEVDDVDELKALISGKIGEPFQLEVQSNILR